LETLHSKMLLMFSSTASHIQPERSTAALSPTRVPVSPARARVHILSPTAPLSSEPASVIRSPPASNVSTPSDLQSPSLLQNVNILGDIRGSPVKGGASLSFVLSAAKAARNLYFVHDGAVPALDNHLKLRSPALQEHAADTEIKCVFEMKRRPTDIDTSGCEAPAAARELKIVQIATVGPPTNTILKKHWIDEDIWADSKDVWCHVENFCGDGEGFPGVPARKQRTFEKFRNWQACLADPIQAAW
jgi:hypothetical protein